jgi:hypothetical protein
LKPLLNIVRTVLKPPLNCKLKVLLRLLHVPGAGPPREFQGPF